jgi:hypothetical protein
MHVQRVNGRVLDCAQMLRVSGTQTNAEAREDVGHWRGPEPWRGVELQ